MFLRWLSERYEYRLHAERTRRAEAALPPPVGRDENNMFSLQEVVGVPDVDVISFDFFDTLFFREHLCLAQVFEKTAQLGARLVPGDRDRALQALYAARGFPARQLKHGMQMRGEGDEPPLAATFERVLRPLVDDLELRKVIADELVGIETEIELRNLEPNERLHAVLRNLKLLGRRIIITSDMYLPGSSIRKIVEKHGIDRYVDELIVSCDYGITKNSGDLFRVVIEKAGVPPDRILHVGDNWNNDVVQARGHGLKAFHYFNHDRETQVRRVESIHNLPCPTSVRQGRIRRAFNLAKKAPLTSLDEVIEQVIGPACALFMHDVLHRASRRNTSDIYFLTRDGTIFKEIADAMKAEIPALYPARAAHRILACSRATGVLLGVRRTDSDYLYINTEYLTERKFSFEGFLDLYLIPRDRVAALPGETLGFIDHVGDAMSIEQFRDLYWSYPGFQDLVMEVLERRRAPITAYLAQIGLFEAHNPILVDIGYSGTWGKQISATLEKMEFEGRSLPNMEFEFFASNRFFTGNVQQLHPSLTMRPGRILDHRSIRYLTIALNYCWLEPFFLDPALGKLEGFSDGNDIRPVFAEPRWKPADRARIESLRSKLIRRCVKFADDLLRHEGDVEEIRREVLDRLVALVGTPRRAEALALNALSHERGMKSVDEQEIAIHLSPFGLRRKLVYMIENDYWVQGSLARSGLGFLNGYMAWRYERDRPRLLDWRP